ncbi:LuxR family transcriptional regulator [Rhizobium sp. NZLR1b]|nr:LuxR family transcriptional regulator [Rhizobium sp. NZLR1b]MBX5192655.1 LuxR family transcriptional regulator [Rhizobium sp. NZLR3b]
MNDALRNLIDTIEASRDEVSIKAALRNYGNEFGLEKYAYIDASGVEIRAFSNYTDEWQQTYLARRHSSIDPVVTEAKRRREAFAWSADDWSVRGMSELRKFRDQAIDFGVRCGVTIGADGSFGSKMMLTFATSEARTDLRALEHTLDAVQALTVIHYRLRFIAANIPLGPRRILSPRESTCVTWAAKGKSAFETAMLTGINPRTVQHYLDSARRKLEAATVPQLVAIAKDYGLI